MKRLLILLILLLALPAYGQQCGEQVARLNMHVGGSVTAACDPATNEVGDRSNHTGNTDLAADTLYCIGYTANCTGTLEYPFVKHDYNDFNQDNDDIEIAVYTYDGAGAPDIGSEKKGNAIQINNNSSEGWIQAGTKMTGSVTNGSNYLLCAVVGPQNWRIYRNNTTGTRTIWSIAGTYGSTPANLAGTWTEVNTTYDWSIYVRIE